MYLYVYVFVPVFVFVFDDVSQTLQPGSQSNVQTLLSKHVQHCSNALPTCGLIVFPDMLLFFLCWDIWFNKLCVNQFLQTRVATLAF